MQTVTTVKDFEIVIRQLEELKETVRKNEENKASEHNFVVHNNEVLVEVKRKAQADDYVVFDGVDRVSYNTIDGEFYRTHVANGDILYTSNGYDFSVYDWPETVDVKVFKAIGNLPQSALVVEAFEPILIENGTKPSCKHLTANQKRRYITLEANRFFKQTIENARNHRGKHRGNIRVPDSRFKFRPWSCKEIKFEVNAVKRTVVALAIGFETGTVVEKAIAKCAPGDVFNAHIGKAIAIGRLFNKDVSEFENAVQPNKRTDGMLIEWRGKKLKIDPLYIQGRTCHFDSEHARYGKIIDDTYAEYVIEGGDK